MKIAANNKQPIDLNKIKAVVASDLGQLDTLIIDTLSSDISLIQAIVSHILKGGGKRLRPLVVLLIARALSSDAFDEQIELAAIIEFVHTATLLHDDVIDRSSLRRGQPTANRIWGDHAPVLVGDFLYSRAFELLTQRNHAQVMQTLAKTTNVIAEGEVLQLANQGQLIDADMYFDVIYRKTAVLFESACECAAVVGHQSTSKRLACKQFGYHFGIAFQIMDDILDYTADSNNLGKNVGDDIQEGKMTLPLIYAMEETDASQRATIQQAIETKNADPKAILAIIHSTQAIERALSKAQSHSQQAATAINMLPNNAFSHALNKLVLFAQHRGY